MSARLFLKPSKPGLIVRHPRTHRVLPEGGAWVSDNQFYRRRIAAGDAVQATPPQAATPPAPPAIAGAVGKVKEPE